MGIRYTPKMKTRGRAKLFYSWKNSDVKYESQIPFIVQIRFVHCVHELSLFLGTCTFLGKQDSLDVGQDASLSDGNASEEFV